MSCCFDLHSHHEICWKITSDKLRRNRSNQGSLLAGHSYEVLPWGWEWSLWDKVRWKLMRIKSAILHVIEPPIWCTRLWGHFESWMYSVKNVKKPTLYIIDETNGGSRCMLNRHKEITLTVHLGFCRCKCSIMILTHLKHDWCFRLTGFAPVAFHVKSRRCCHEMPIELHLMVLKPTALQSLVRPVTWSGHLIQTHPTLTILYYF